MTAPLATPAPTSHAPGRYVVAATALLGLWYVISPFVIGSYQHEPLNEWNNVVAGILIAVLAVYRVEPSSARWAVWLDALIGLWVFCSPWIYRYTADTGRFVNALCVGAAVFGLSMFAGMRPRRTAPVP